jgi:hypothetical protein
MYAWLTDSGVLFSVLGDLNAVGFIIDNQSSKDSKKNF